MASGDTKMGPRRVGGRFVGLPEWRTERSCLDIQQRVCHRAAPEEVPRADDVIHLHGLVFSGWLFLLAGQAALVYRRRSNLHRRVGYWGAGYGCLVIVMGLIATMISPVVHVARGEWTVDEAAAFLILPLET